MPSSAARWSAEAPAPPPRRRWAMRLKDQVALVTGGSRGIGRSIVKAFVAEGAKVALVYKGNQQAADSLVQELSQANGTVFALQADVTNAAEAESCVQQVEKRWGR